MARTITFYGPEGFATPRVELVSQSDVLTEDISMTEQLVAKGRYDGSISSAGAGKYTAVIYDGLLFMGIFGEVELSGIDPEAVTIRSTVNSATAPATRQQKVY